MGGPSQLSEAGPSTHRPGAAFTPRYGHGWRLNDSIEAEEEDEGENTSDEEDEADEDVEIAGNEREQEASTTAKEAVEEELSESNVIPTSTGRKSKRVREETTEGVGEVPEAGKDRGRGLEKKRRTAR